MTCVFCGIVGGSIPSVKVYEDEDTLAFFDIRPAAPAHTLVIPKKHVERIEQMDDASLQKFIVTVKRTSNALQKTLKADGINTVSNSGKAAGQIVFHAHVHLLPRFETDGKPFDWPRSEFNQEEAQEMAEKIKQSF